MHDPQEVPERPERARRWRRGVHPTVELLGAYSWRLIGIGIVVVAVVWLVSRLQLVLIPVVIALFLARALTPPASWLRRHRWPPSLAAGVAILGFFVVLLGFVAAIAPSIVDELDSIGPTVTQAFDDVENWLVEDAPIDISRSSIDRLRERSGERFDNLFRQDDGEVLDSATLAAEILAGALLAVILTFFMIRDGARFVKWSVGLAPRRHRAAVERSAHRAWLTLGGYLRGAAILGVVEAIIIGLTLWVSGGGLVVPIMAITFLAAFVPIVGAITAGVLAVLIGLVTGGVATALIVGIVALVVQQLDNDILAPFIYGRALNLHPVTVLLSVATGAALFGLAGALLAVPAVAVAVNTFDEWRFGALPEDGTGAGTVDDTEGGADGADPPAGPP
jgi:predicted PurR-regulated permease PerM